ncbi:MAG: hypothetical protein WAU01_13115, partial [Saprospiraceae bacterium]
AQRVFLPQRTLRVAQRALGFFLPQRTLRFSTKGTEAQFKLHWYEKNKKSEYQTSRTFYQLKTSIFQLPLSSASG